MFAKFVCITRISYCSVALFRLVRPKTPEEGVAEISENHQGGRPPHAGGNHSPSVRRRDEADGVVLSEDRPHSETRLLVASS